MKPLIRPLVFVCHNRKDKPIAEQIATAILAAGHEAFFDKWDIKPGDSLIEKISTGITGSSYLLVLLSKHSVKSRWVQKELEIALARQIADKHIKVIPCLLDECEIPVFLEPIVYADFRHSFEHGLHELLSGITKVDAVASGRLKEGQEAWVHDWAIDYLLPDLRTGMFSVRLVTLSFYATEKFSCYCFVDCTAGSDLQRRMAEYPENLALERYLFFLSVIRTQFERIIQETGKDFGVWLGDEHEHNLTLTLTKAGSDELYLSVDMRARRLGELGEKATMLWVGRLWAEFIDDHIRDVLSKVPQALKQEWREWVDNNPCNGKVQLVQRFEEKY